MAYQPFLIAPFGTGLDSDQESWMLPVDAFTEIENGHIRHGYIEKRKGYRQITNMSNSREIQSATSANPAVFTVASATGIANGNTVTIYSMSGGSWANLNSTSYTIQNLAASSFELVDLNGTVVDGSALGAYTVNSGRLGTLDGLRIMGIFRYISSANIRETLIANTEQVGLYDSQTQLVKPLDLVSTSGTVYPDDDAFTAGDNNYIWSANWQHSGAVNRVYFTNGLPYTGTGPGKDGILYYNGGSQIQQFKPILDTTGNNFLQGCKLIFSLRQRLVCLHTVEENTGTTRTHPQRARWCKSQNPNPTDGWFEDVAGSGGFVDAPTGEQIISARELQDVIIVHFTDSVWTLRPVPNPALPFRWDKINSFRACDGRMASIGYDRYSVGVGTRGITATDGVETRRVDDRITDFVSNEVEDSEFEKLFVERSFSNQRTWFLYPSSGSTDANSALIYDDESSAYSTYKIGMNVLGHSSVSRDYTAQDFIEINKLDVSAEEMNDETALSFFWSKNAEVFLGGDREGKVYVMETLNTDDGSSIDFNLKSAGWNPFKDQGLEAQFGYIDFYLNSDQYTSIEVSFYKNNSLTAYAKQSLDLLPNLNYRSSISNVVVNVDPTTGFTVTSKSHGLSNNDTCFFYGVTGSTFLNDREWTVGAAIAENTFNVDTDITSLGKAITGITNANPAVLTSVGHSFVNGDIVYIVNVTTMIQVNNLPFTVANATDDTFELSGIDSTLYGVYGGGGYIFYNYKNNGKIFERKFFRTKVWKRAYAGGIGYEHSMRLTIENNDEPFQIHAFKPWFQPRGRVLG